MWRLFDIVLEFFFLVLDSSGQEEPGYLFTNFIWTGLMSLCKDVNQPFLEDSKSPYNIDFVSVLLNHVNPMQMQLYMANNVSIHLIFNFFFIVKVL